MSEPAIGGTRPHLVKFEGEKPLFWCACGRSGTQPFCDGSHKGTDFTPLRVAARHPGEEALLCTCKQTKTPPYCDGSHNALRAKARDSIDWSGAAEVPRDARGLVCLDGGSYVLTPDWNDAEEMSGWRALAVITAATGAEKLSQYLLRPGATASPLDFGAAEVVLFIVSGEAEISIGGRPFAAPAHSALSLRPGERFTAKGEAIIAATVCPPAPPAAGELTKTFDDRYPSRLERPDDASRVETGERFYQTLTSEKTGAGDITQFIGWIPASRAYGHRHLYEEAILILSGDGVMWTEGKKAAVAEGDVIYLPRKQLHSLECTSAGGMTLAGSFFPAGSPAVNY